MVYRPARYQPVKSKMISAEPVMAISAPTHLAITCEEVPHRQQQSQHACGGDRVVEECDVGVGECSGSQPDWEDPTGIPGPWFELAEWDCDDYQGVEGEGGEAHE